MNTQIKISATLRLSIVVFFSLSGMDNKTTLTPIYNPVYIDQTSSLSSSPQMVLSTNYTPEQSYQYALKDTIYTAGIPLFLAYNKKNIVCALHNNSVQIYPHKSGVSHNGTHYSIAETGLGGIALTDNNKLITCSSMRAAPITLWDLNTYSHKKSIPQEHKILSILSNDDLIVSCDNATQHIYKNNTLEQLLLEKKLKQFLIVSINAYNKISSCGGTSNGKMIYINQRDLKSSFLFPSSKYSSSIHSISSEEELIMGGSLTGITLWGNPNSDIAFDIPVENNTKTLFKTMTIISGHTDGTIQMRDIRKPEYPFLTLQLHKKAITTLIQGKKHLISGSEDGTVKIWRPTLINKPPLYNTSLLDIPL